ILNVLTEYYYSAKFGSNPALDLDMPDSPEISGAVVEDIMNNRCVDLKHVRTINDFKILQTSWVFDISFPYALQYIAEKKYVEKIIGVLPREPVVARVHAHINDFLGCVTKN
ncbi:MAG: hypothetical protein GY757_22900, partial [bacterium]|nr:hypothetical protein [bacterium]